MPIWFLLLALAMPLSGVQAAALYAQSPSNSGVGVDSSMTVPDGSDADIIAYDYFTATASGTVTNISWQGSSIGNLEFTVLIQSDVATPDSPIPQRVTVAQYTVPAGAANPAPTSVTGWYNFSYTLPTPFDLTSGQFYAISIAANNGGWQWANGTGGEGLSSQYNVGAKLWSYASGDRTFSLNDASTPPTLVTSTLSAGEVGLAYSQALITTGTAPYNLQVTGEVPPGLTVDPASGVISGTPTSALNQQGTNSFTFSAATGNTIYTFNLSIAEAVTITTLSLPNGQVGSAYPTTSIDAAKGVPPYTVTLNGTLPNGLSFAKNQATGKYEISGNPTAAGTANLTANVTDAIGAVAQQSLSLTVANATPAPPTPTPPTPGPTTCTTPAGASKAAGQGRINAIGAGTMQIGSKSVQMLNCTQTTVKKSAGTIRVGRRAEWKGYRVNGVTVATSLKVE